jgi:hypothetical protein
MDQRGSATATINRVLIDPWIEPTFFENQTAISYRCVYPSWTGVKGICHQAGAAAALTPVVTVGLRGFSPARRPSSSRRRS